MSGYAVNTEVFASASPIAERVARTYSIPVFSATAVNPGTLDLCGRWSLGNAESLALALPLPDDFYLAIKFGTTRYLFSAFMDGYDVYNGETIDPGAEIEIWSAVDLTSVEAIELVSSVLDGTAVTLTFAQA